MNPEDEMEVSLLSLVNWTPICFGEKNGDDTTQFYRAQDERDGSLVFIKKINLSKDTFNEYQAEVSALTALKYTNNIIELVETGIESQKVGNQMEQFGYILLSYAGEIDLCDAICNYKWKYDEKDFISFSHNLIQAVHNIHLRGFIHRDLKLENIVLDLFSIDKERGEFSFHPDSFSIIDFGSSLNVVNWYSNMNYESLVHFRRTQKYTPPEFINEGSLTDKYDIFSCGIILFSLIAGHFPKFNFSIDQNDVICYFLPYDNIDDLFNEDCWKNVSNEIIRMIKSMLSYDPMLRPTTNDLLKLDMFRCLDSQLYLPCEEDEPYY